MATTAQLSDVHRDLTKRVVSRTLATPGVQAQYLARVHEGRARMRESRVVICGLARNVATMLPATIRRIEILGRLFADYRVVIYENDSVDETSRILSDWQTRNVRVSFLSERRGDPVNRSIRCLQRATRMAYYREQCRNYATSQFADFDYVAVVDTDLKAGWSNDGVAHTFGHSRWDFVGAYGIIQKGSLLNRRQLQYDSWAFRSKGSYDRVATRTVNRMHWNVGDPLVEVYSCFGGLGIYSMTAISAGRYDGTDCEHVALHRSMRKAGYGRMYLNPSQLAHYGFKPSKIHRVYAKWRKLDLAA